MKSTGRAALRGAVLGVIVAAAALAGHHVMATPGMTISQRHREFHPDAVTVARGTVLRIVNDDNVTHHVYVDAPNMKFDSGEQPIGTTVDLRFDHAGTFTVRCAIHPTMHLIVTVK